MITQEAAMGLTALAGWIWWVDRRVSAHEEVIKNINSLIQVMLEDRLAQDKERRHAAQSDYRSGGR